MSTHAEPTDQRVTLSPTVADSMQEDDSLWTIIRPHSGWQLINVSELWRFRELIYFLTWRDVKVRYKQTALGAAWAILQPMMMMLVFTILFSRLGGAEVGGIPYSLFAFSGLLPWTFFATAVANAGNSVVGSEGLISKVYFPRLAVPLSAAGAPLVDFVIALGMLFVLMGYYHDHVTLSWSLLLVPVVLAIICLTALGVGTILAALNVAYRDVRHVVPFMIQLWLFSTPSVYMPPGAGQTLPIASNGILAQLLLAINPMIGMISTFRAAALGGDLSWTQLAISAGWAVLLFLIGCFYFRKVEDTFVDII
jgi:lipopolysaccharide transport system permease protein